jgi:hypothetical protein
MRAVDHKETCETPCSPITTCLNLIGVDDKMLCQMNAETQAIEEGAGTQHAIIPSAGAGNVSKRIRGVGYDQHDGGRRRAHDTRNDVAIDFGVLAQQPQSVLGIATVRGASRLFR